MRHTHLRDDTSGDHYAVGTNTDARTVLVQLQGAGEQVRLALTVEQAEDLARQVRSAAERLTQAAWQRHGIVVGQVYVPADNARNRLIVRDVHTYADCDDVVVFDERLDAERRIDAFELAHVRYRLHCDDASRTCKEMLPELRAGRADARTQQRLATAVGALLEEVRSLQPDARRGRLAVEQGTWYRNTDELTGRVTTRLCVQVADNADLSCKAFRALALDALSESLRKAQPSS